MPYRTYRSQRPVGAIAAPTAQAAQLTAVRRDMGRRPAHKTCSGAANAGSSSCGAQPGAPGPAKVSEALWRLSARHHYIPRPRASAGRVPAPGTAVHQNPRFCCRGQGDLLTEGSGPYATWVSSSPVPASPRQVSPGVATRPELASPRAFSVSAALAATCCKVCALASSSSTARP